MRAKITLRIEKMGKQGRWESRELRYEEEAPEGVARAVCEALGAERMEDTMNWFGRLPHAWTDRPWEYLRKVVTPVERAMMQPAERLVMLPAIARFAEKLEKGKAA